MNNINVSCKCIGIQIWRRLIVLLELNNISVIRKVLQKARSAFATGRTRDVNFRIQQLEALLRMYHENEAEIVTALYKDLRKPKYEARMFEIEVLKNDVRTMIQNCKEWAKPERVSIRTFLILFLSF